MPAHLLFVTDSRRDGPTDTIFPVLRHLATDSRIASLWVFDRAIEANAPFFEAQDPAVEEVRLRRIDGEYQCGSNENYPLETRRLSEFDAAWLTLMPPLPSAQLAYFSRRLADKVVINDPMGIDRTGSKAFLPEAKMMLGDMVPPVRVCGTAPEIMAFHRDHPDLVVKALSSSGGKAVRRLRREGECEIHDQDEMAAFMHEHGPVLAQELLMHPEQSDNRLMVLDGEIIGALERRPKAGGWICNYSAGGSLHLTEPSAREYEMIARLAPIMSSYGVLFYGVDTLLNARGERVLQEVNSARVGGIAMLEARNGEPLTARVADRLAREFGQASKG